MLVECVKGQERDKMRVWARAQRDGLDRLDRARASARIGAQACALPEVLAAKSVLLYCAFRSEVATATLAERLLALGKTVCVPLTVPEKQSMLPLVLHDYGALQPGYQGIPEPRWREAALFPALSLDIVILPGLLFDRRGNRLGYGGGYYDRFLSGNAPQALRLGLAFSCQLVDLIPAEPHDMRLDILITEQETIRWPQESGGPATNST